MFQSFTNSIKELNESIDSLKMNFIEVEERLDAEKQEREEEKRNHDSKLSLVTKEATEKEQKITNELNSLQEELLKLQKLHDLNLEKKLEIE